MSGPTRPAPHAGEGVAGEREWPDPTIFREYDIRGVVGKDLTGELAEAVGRAYASELRERGGENPPVVAVGWDNRPSSPDLSTRLMRGLRGGGVDVLEIGTVPTPVLYHATEHFGTAGGIQVTGSHNPPEYNGLKMVMAGRPVYGQAIQDLRRRIVEGDMLAGDGAVRAVDALGAYLEDVAPRFSLSRPVRVVVDCGNGSGSLIAVDLLRAIGADVIPLFCDSDGTFPNHHPDPVVDENLVDLIEEVRRTGAELGVAFDGDADRIGAVDERGGIIRGDILLLLFGVDLLERRSEPFTLIFDVKCSEAVPEVFAARGGTPLMWKTGHSLIKEKMKEIGSPLAGELSGHVCFGEDYYGFDDALYAAGRLLEIVAGADRPLSRLVGDFPRYVSTPEIRVDVPEGDKFAIVRRAQEAFRGTHDVIDVDGIRVRFKDGWGLLRASNTQPVLVLRYEASDRAALLRIRETMEGWLRGEGVDLTGSVPSPVG